jgi:hypothetical protein
MTDLIFKVLLLVVIVVALVFILIKEIKRRREEIIEKNKSSFSKKEKKKIQKDIENQKNDNPLNFVQEGTDEISKLLFNLEDMVDRESEEDKISKNKENLNFFSTVINNDTSFVKSAKGSIVLEEEDLKAISGHLDLKLGSELASMIQRVDEDGNIILGMEALRFITGDNIPLITPSGSIRVLNLLSLEEDILLSIETGKPLFILDKKNNTVKKIEKDELEILVRYKEELEIKNIADNNIKEVKELVERNGYLEKNIDELNTKLLKLEAQNELYEKLLGTKKQETMQDNKDVLKNSPVQKIEPKIEPKIESKETEQILENLCKIENKEDKKEDKKENIKQTIDIHNNVKEDESFESKDETKQENQNIKNEKIEDFIVVKEQNDIIKNSQDNKNKDIDSKNNFLKDTKIEYVKNDESLTNEKDDLKSLNKKTSENFLEDFFLQYLLGKNGGDNRNTKINDLNFISYEQESFSKVYLLRYLYKNTINLLKKFLIENGYKDDDKNINLIISNEKIEIKENAYFLNTKDMQLYKSKIIQIKFSQDDISPYALINEKQNGFRGGLTQEENQKLMERTLDRKTVAIYQRNLNCIANNQFIKIDEK